MEVMERVFETEDADWRGLGLLPRSGLRIRKEFASFDASSVFPIDPPQSEEPRGCRCGEVLRGILPPPRCPLYRRVCNLENPVGPCMVSSEGACSAYLQFGEEQLEERTD
jgi:hydrogenase expression/formation protein HypD